VEVGGLATAVGKACAKANLKRDTMLASKEFQAADISFSCGLTFRHYVLSGTRNPRSLMERLISNS
jgi:hypothetical protein